MAYGEVETCWTVDDTQISFEKEGLNGTVKICYEHEVAGDADTPEEALVTSWQRSLSRRFSVYLDSRRPFDHVLVPSRSKL